MTRDGQGQRSVGERQRAGVADAGRRVPAVQRRLALVVGGALGLHAAREQEECE